MLKPPLLLALSNFQGYWQPSCPGSAAWHTHSCTKCLWRPHLCEWNGPDTRSLDRTRTPSYQTEGKSHSRFPHLEIPLLGCVWWGIAAVPAHLQGACQVLDLCPLGKSLHRIAVAWKNHADRRPSFKLFEPKDARLRSLSSTCRVHLAGMYRFVCLES